MSTAPPALYVVNGLPKCGSSWTCFCLQRASVLQGMESVTDARHKHGVRVNDSGNPGRLSMEIINTFIASGDSYVIKTQSPYQQAFRPLIENGQLKVITIVRHPFDVIASSIDYGAAMRQKNDTSSPYCAIHTIEDALGFMRPFWECALSWQEEGEFVPALLLRYEDMVRDPKQYIHRAITYFWPDKEEGERERITRQVLQEHDVRQDDANLYKSKSELKFNKGKSLRYLDDFNDSELATLRESLGDVCDRLGYAN